MGLLNIDSTFFIYDFDETTEQHIIPDLYEKIQDESKKKDGSITLMINSPGGYTHVMFHMVDLVEMAKRSGVVVRTVVPDMAFSCGSMLAITGSPGERYIAKSAKHLIHLGYQASGESTMEQIERNLSEKRAHFKKILNLYKTYANVPDLEKHVEDDNFYVDAAKAIRWGLADKYTDKFVIS